MTEYKVVAVVRHATEGRGIQLVVVCPKCHRQVRRDIKTWALFGGRCRRCETKIEWDDIKDLDIPGRVINRRTK